MRKERRRTARQEERGGEEKEHDSVWDRNASLRDIRKKCTEMRLEAENQDILPNMGTLVLSVSWK